MLNGKGEVLVVSQNGNSWSLPKGHLEKGEELVDTARREIAEESGVRNLAFIKQLPSYKRFRIGSGGVGEDMNELKTIHMFMFRTDEQRLEPSDPDNPEARWVNKNEVADMLTHPKDKEFFQSIMFELLN